MSLYEAYGCLFYGIRVQRHGRHESDTHPLGTSEDGAGEIAESAVKDRLRALGHDLPDWFAVPEGPARTDAYRSFKAKLAELSFGCELEVMGSGENDDEVIYAIVSESQKTCGSEDDHGGFGEKVLQPNELVAAPEWDARLRSFCALMDIPYAQPRWTLSMRG